MEILTFTPNTPIKSNQVATAIIPYEYGENYEWIAQRGYILLKIKCEDSAFLVVILPEILDGNDSRKTL